LQRCLQKCQREARNDDGSKIKDNDHDAKWRLEQLRHINDRIKLRRHGPAVQMDVMDLPPIVGPTNKIYSVDMVPTIAISNRNGENDYYVAKPMKATCYHQIAWRRSFSVKEKERLTTLDGGNGCRKQVLRVLKVIRNREPGLAQLTSYHLKTALFRKIDELPDSAQWRIECLGQRLMDVIGQLRKDLENGFMQHYYLKDVNLLDGMKEPTVINMHNRLKNLMNCQKGMMGLVQP